MCLCICDVVFVDVFGGVRCVSRRYLLQLRWRMQVFRAVCRKMVASFSNYSMSPTQINTLTSKWLICVIYFILFFCSIRWGKMTILLKQSHFNNMLSWEIMRLIYNDYILCIKMLLIIWFDTEFYLFFSSIVHIMWIEISSRPTSWFLIREIEISWILFNRQTTPLSRH